MLQIASLKKHDSVTFMGRTPAIPADQEKRLAEALKTMEQWGFDITTLEVLNIVAKFVEMNNIKTSFKNAVP
ncbi:hypothetical protein ILUMI_18738, partial [Ignelater luminosus]